MAPVRITASPRKYAQEREEVVVAGDGRGGHPVARRRLPGDQGAIGDGAGGLRCFVNGFVRDEDIGFMKELHAPVSDTDEVSIVQAIAGG